MGLVRMRSFFSALVNHLSHCASRARVFMLRLGEWLRRGVRCTRVFLETKKRLIEVLGILAAILFGIAQVKIMCEQTKISDKQAEITRWQTLPNFIINRTPWGEGGQGEALTIANEGFPIGRLDHMWAVHLRFSIQGHGSYPTSVTYYSKPDGDKVGKGLLRTLLPCRCNAVEFGRIQEEFQQALQKDRLTGDCALEILLRLDYWDIGGGFHTQYFRIDPGHGPRNLADDEDMRKAEAAIQQYWKCRPKDLEEITTAELNSVVRFLVRHEIDAYLLQ